MLRLAPSLLLAVLLLAPGLPAGAAPPTAKEYFAIRDRATIVSDFAAEQIGLQPESFENRVLELRGLVTGLLESDRHRTVLIERSRSVAPIAVAVPDGDDPAKWSFLDVGLAVRCLTRVVRAGGTGAGSLEAIALIQEHQAATEEEARALAAEAKARDQAAREAIRRAAEARRATAPPRDLGSRGAPAAARQQAGQVVRYTREQLIEIYAGAVRYFNGRISPAQARKIAACILDYSNRHGLDPRLTMAVVAVESNFNPTAVSRAGAMGLGQLMPGTAGGLGVSNAFDVEQNLHGSTRLLGGHLRTFKRNGYVDANGNPTEDGLKLALACYNAGAGAVNRHKGIPPYRETRAYVVKVTRLYRQMRGLE